MSVVEDGASITIADGQAQSEAQPLSQLKNAPHRACEECKRKKTRCDMTRPICSLCARVGSVCVFPTKRKRRESNLEKKPSKRQATKAFGNEELSRLLELIDSGALREKISEARQAVSPGVHRHESTEDLATQPSPFTRSDATRNSITSEQMPIPTELSHSPDGPGAVYQQPDPVEGQSNLPFWYSDDFSSLLDPNYILDPSELLSMPLFPGENGNPYMAMEGLRDDSIISLEQDISTPYRLSISASTADDLIETFFSKIHSFLPIFHHRKFYDRYVRTHQPEEERYAALSAEAALILNSMFALCARFTDSAAFEGILVKQRGLEFASQAQSIYQGITQASEPETASLEYLQGCILLAFYQQVSGLSSKAWILTGFCTRLAYELGLNLIDEDILASAGTEIAQWSSIQDWVQREERRRAWWSVWELDTFASTLSCRPFTIDRNRMHVLLPASDENWFSDNPIESRFLASDPLVAWKSLVGSPNQDERAWFLVCNFLMELATEISQRRPNSLQAKRDMETALTCFALILPRQFSLSSGSLIFDEHNFKKSNWIISTNLMLQGARCFTSLLPEVNPTESKLTGMSPNHESPDQNHNSMPIANLNSTSINSTAPDQSSVDQCLPFTNEMLRAIRLWSPDFIAFSGPCIACTIIGPASLNIAIPREEMARKRAFLNREMIELVITRFAEYWELGSLLLELFQAVNALESSPNSTLTIKRKETAVRFAVLLPRIRSRFRTRFPHSSEGY